MIKAITFSPSLRPYASHAVDSNQKRYAAFTAQALAVHNIYMDLHSPQPRPQPLRDTQLLATLVGMVVAGVGLYHWLPQGYAADITNSLWLTLNVVLLYPVVEELLFRGVIQGELLRREKTAARHFGISRANMLASALFACLHLIHQAPLWAASVMLPSLVLGHFRERYNSLIAPILLHIVFNATWLSASIASN